MLIVRLAEQSITFATDKDEVCANAGIAKVADKLK